MSSELPVFTLRIMVRLERTIDFITVTGRNNIPEHSDKFHRKNIGGSVNTTVQKFEDAAPFISTVRPTVYTNPSRKRSFISTVRPTVHTKGWFSLAHKHKHKPAYAEAVRC